MPYIIMTLLILALQITPNKAQAANFNLFNTGEIKSTDISAFTKWTDVLTRANKEIANYECPTHTPHCKLEEWKTLIATLRYEDKITQIHRVNNFVNNINYVEDNNNIWKKKDYWATPKQFFANAGDCEDFAIAKYVTLKKLGFTDRELRLVIVEDSSLYEIHAVLAVHIDNAIYILDNQSNLVMRDKKIKHYTPIYSINAQSWWKHLA